MSRLFKFASALLAAAILVAGAAQAQVSRLNPSYGTANLSAGFPNDPRTRNVVAGGNIRLPPVGDCPGGGYVARAPDYRVNYTAGNWPLIFYARSRGDTILLVNDPAGRWYCNDDFQGLDPAIEFVNPRSGRYDIWVGTYGSNRVRAMLYITSTRPFFR